MAKIMKNNQKISVPSLSLSLIGKNFGRFLIQLFFVGWIFIFERSNQN